MPSQKDEKLRSLFEHLIKGYVFITFVGSFFGFFLASLLNSDTGELIVYNGFFLCVCTLLSFLLYRQHLKSINQIGSIFEPVKNISIPHSSTYMIFGAASKPVEKIYFLKQSFIFFWVAGWCLGTVLALLFFKGGMSYFLSTEDLKLKLIGLATIGIIFFFRKGLILWDIPYLKKIYEENTHDKHSYHGHKD